MLEQGNEQSQIGVVGESFVTAAGAAGVGVVVAAVIAAVVGGGIVVGGGGDVVAVVAGGIGSRGRRIFNGCAHFGE